MDYYRYQIKTDPGNAEIILAFLSELPFESFTETTQGLDAFLPANAATGQIADALEGLRERFPFTYERSLIKEENWNVNWESNFDPVVVDDFCAIRADFHEPVLGVEHELVITPKMAFGTGHHETTHLMIQTMRTIDFQGEKVLDYGCGTGILSILASRLGASRVDAVDIELASYENTIENCAGNQVGNVSPVHGTLSNITGGAYGVVLANINRNVILSSLSSLSKKIKKSGTLIISGFVPEDEMKMRKALEENGFDQIETNRRNNWLVMKCLRV